ncbi:unnamed protein product [Fusarium graminearum]|uniref:Uncharacterized protein n=1 Tax=Gibberella zeae TaxID=5518 RepID=A0A9N8RDF1_GIBZA|nr:unnamed protein product [Fusarium graminearum]CZS85628.1 unnamed protein product [Fusarium graminearum]
MYKTTFECAQATRTYNTVTRQGELTQTTCITLISLRRGLHTEASDCKPKVYISVKKKVQQENTDLEDTEEHHELLDALLIQASQRGLPSPALYWFEEKRLSEETFSGIER